MEITIPGTGTLNIKNLLLDYNGTLAVDGKLIAGVHSLLNELSDSFSIHVVTADTFGFAGSELEDVKCTFTRLPSGNQSEAKLRYLDSLGREFTASIGNGRNDRFMLEHSAIGICVVQGEGAFTETLLASDIVFNDIIQALDFFRNPKRIIATMRD